ncbi:hypothetical protein [Nocardia nova]|uniref:hypothetical protein n=1 Tax=Nocardia nova TaxID=37330 RepID=UPI000AB27571|nr:hypothetical protein [Nocardia nova]
MHTGSAAGKRSVNSRLRAVTVVEPKSWRGDSEVHDGTWLSAPRGSLTRNDEGAVV